MLNELRKFIAQVTADAEADVDSGDEDLRLATAALLVHTATVDGHLAGAERRALTALLERHFDLDRTEAVALVGDAEKRERDAVDIYSFTSVLQKRLTPDERKGIIRLMWEVVAADGEVHTYESNLVWRAAELIGVSTRDRVLMRQEVFDAAGVVSNPST